MSLAQLFKIFDLLGTPGQNKSVRWQSVETLPYFNDLFPNIRPKDLKQHPSTAELCACPEAEDLLRKMLLFDPHERISAAEALRHPFLCDPSPTSPPRRKVSLLSPPGSRPYSLASQASELDPAELCVWDVWRRVEAVQLLRTERMGGSQLPARVEQLRDQTARNEGLAGVAATSPAVITPQRLQSSGQSADVALREHAVVWMLRVSNEFCQCDRTVHLAVAILDHVERSLRKPSRQDEPVSGLCGWSDLLAIASLLLACKFQEVEIHMLREFLYYCTESHESAEVLAAELAICSALQMEFAIPSSVDFLYCAMQRLHWPSMFAVHRGMHDQVAMLAQYLCELSLLSYECAQQPASLVASGAFCLSLACLRCGLWRDGAPGPSDTPTRYWTPSMVQATGYASSQLEAVLPWLRIEHDQAHARLGMQGARPSTDADDATDLAEQPIDKHETMHLKFSHPRFLGALEVPPFAPHSGGERGNPVRCARSPSAC